MIFNKSIKNKEKIMFREMRRKKQQLEESECVEILKNEKRGVLSVIGDDGYPYGIPMDHYYHEENGKIYFHCALEGHKMDAVKACDKVSYCVFDEGYRNEGEWALNIKSVIVFGRVRVLDDHEQGLRMAELLAEKFTDDRAYIDHELNHSGPRMACLEITPEHMTGKLVNES